MPSLCYRQFIRWILLFFIAIPAASLAGEPVTLHTSDDVSVFGTLTKARQDNDKILLLFHQARANRAEYAAVLPALTQTGYDTLAIDQRSGGHMFKSDNETVSQRGDSSDYLDALPDLEVALKWADKHDYATIVPVGSSYTASLVILLAAQKSADG